MRLGGLFPFPLTGAALNAGQEAIALPSGGQWQFPEGFFMVTLGYTTMLQYFDPNDGQWRSNGYQPGQSTMVSSDGANYRLFNSSGTVVGAQITNAGSGALTNGIGPAVTGVTVSFGAPAGGAPATAQGYAIIGGTVAAPTVAQGGSGFTDPPLVFCDPPPAGGIQATFTSAITSAGVLTSITQVNAGAGYTSVPNFYLVPQAQFYTGQVRFPLDTLTAMGLSAAGGAPGLINPLHAWPGSPYQANLITGPNGALLTLPTAVGGSGTLTGIVITDGGNGYTGATLPAISFAGGGLAGGVAATALMSFSALTAVGATLTPSGVAGVAYLANSRAEVATGQIAGAIGYYNNAVLFSRPISGTTTGTVGAFIVSDPGAGILSATNLGVNGGPATTIAVLAASQVGGITDTNLVQFVGASG